MTATGTITDYIMPDELTDDQARVLGLPRHAGPNLSDQEIRARALEASVRLLQSRQPVAKDMVFELAKEFETYIKG